MAVPPTSSGSANDKTALRAELRTRRRAFASNRLFIPDITTATHCATVLNLIDAASVVAGYWPLGFEADVRPLLYHAHALGKSIVLPRFDLGTGVMTFHAWTPGQDIDTNTGYTMPPADAPVLAPDLILAPLIGFDRDLNRMGQGGGFYDRAFAAYPRSVKVGIAWSVQEVAQLPIETHDIPLDAVLTEKEWITR